MIRTTLSEDTTNDRGCHPLVCVFSYPGGVCPDGVLTPLLAAHHPRLATSTPVDSGSWIRRYGPVLPLLATVVAIYGVWYVVDDLWLLPDGRLDAWGSQTVVHASHAALSGLGIDARHGRPDRSFVRHRKRLPAGPPPTRPYWVYLGLYQWALGALTLGLLAVGIGRADWGFTAYEFLSTDVYRGTSLGLPLLFVWTAACSAPSKAS